MILFFIRSLVKQCTKTKDCYSSMACYSLYMYFQTMQQNMFHYIKYYCNVYVSKYK
jgi:hypothetical protein